jgi:hypothetical protein
MCVAMRVKLTEPSRNFSDCADHSDQNNSLVVVVLVLLLISQTRVLTHSSSLCDNRLLKGETKERKRKDRE